MELFNNKSECCGCGECVSVCPKSAISMTSDQDGFLYPIIDNEKCINCGICKRKCAYKNNKVYDVVESKVYAAVNKNHDDLKESASGGAFSALAKWTIDNGGVVCGAAWDDRIQAHHILIDKVEDIRLLQGSKYVNSSTLGIYEKIREKLDAGKMVLFSGTPCQCDAIRTYIGDCEKLITVEIICHGTPSAKIFRDYLDVLEKKLGGHITDVQFRNKKCGWGALMKVEYVVDSAKHVKYYKPEESYYYYYYFYHAAFMRSSCYACKYADEHRFSDFAIGDFWGAQKYVPSYDNYKGISVLIASGKMAEKILPRINEYLTLQPAMLDDVKKENGQLCVSSALKPVAEEAWSQLKNIGPEEFDRQYSKTHKTLIVKAKVRRMIPVWIRRIIRSFMR